MELASFFPFPDPTGQQRISQGRLERLEPQVCTLTARTGPLGPCLLESRRTDPSNIGTGESFPASVKEQELTEGRSRA